VADKKLPIENVSDTALWVAFYRAMESERPDALFRDPYARALAGAKGEAIVNAMPHGRSLAWPMIVRTRVMDEIIAAAIEREGARTVLNLAAGLDVRPFRMDLPPALRWIDADLPGILDYKRAVLGDAKAKCAYEAVAVDLREADRRRELLARAAAAGPVVVLSEGLLIYLEPEQVRELALDLHRETANRAWLIDLASPLMIERVAKRWNQKLTQARAPFRFAPAEGTGFFLPLGWREADFRSIWTESLRLKRTVSMAWLWKFLGVFMPAARRQAYQRMSGVVLLERA